MLELASVGAGVMHSRSIEFAKKFDVPLQVRSSFSDLEGTWIVPETDWMRDVVVCGAAIVRDEARINLNGVPDQPGVSHRVFSAIADKNIVVDMIAQNVGSAGRATIGFTVLRNELPATLAVLRPLAAELGGEVQYEEEVSKVSIVGTGMRTHTGVAEKMFAALAAANINMKMITTGDIKISVLVAKADGVRALRTVDPQARVVADADIAKLFVLGVGMRTHTGVARRMFGALAQRGINISMINTSEVRVSAVVDRQRGEEALACLKEAFTID